MIGKQTWYQMMVGCIWICICFVNAYIKWMCVWIGVCFVCDCMNVFMLYICTKRVHVPQIACRLNTNNNKQHEQHQQHQQQQQQEQMNISQLLSVLGSDRCLPFSHHHHHQWDCCMFWAIKTLIARCLDLDSDFGLRISFMTLWAASSSIKVTFMPFELYYHTMCLCMPLKKRAPIQAYL